MRPRFSRFACCVGLLAGVLSACGGNAPRADEPFVVPVLPPALRASPSAWTLNEPDHPFVGDLPTAVNDVWGELVQAGFEPWDPAEANARGPASDFAHYVTFQEDTSFGVVHHVVFVTAVPWTVDRVDRFLETFYPMPASTPPEAGNPLFHFRGVDPPPFALQYVFGDTWSGWLESALLSSFAEVQARPEQVDAWLSITRRRLAELGIAMDGEDDLAELDAVLSQLPRDEVSTYHPIGTLAGLGLLVGEALRAERPELRWVRGEDGMATLFALAVDGAPDTYLRPVDFVIQAYHADLDEPLQAYLELAVRRLDDVARE